MHHILAVGLKIPRRGLLNVLDSLESFRRLLLHRVQKIQQVLDVGAAFVEVERIDPLADAALLLGFGGYPVNPHHTLHVPLQVVAVQLDLEVGKAVVVDPLGQGLRQAVMDTVLEVGFFQSIDGRNQVVNRQAGPGLLEDVLARILTLVFPPHVVGKVVGHEFGPVSVIAVDAMQLAEGIVDGGVKGAGSNQRAKLGNRFGELHLLRNSLGSLEVHGLQRPVEIDGMAIFFVASGQARDARGQGLHGAQRGVKGHLPGRKRPGVGQRH